MKNFQTGTLQDVHVKRNPLTRRVLLVIKMCKQPISRRLRLHKEPQLTALWKQKKRKHVPQVILNGISYRPTLTVAVKVQLLVMNC